MIFTLGFMIAGLIALAIAPAFWSRAMRLSTRRLQMQLPLSAEEIRAERDLLRAEFAVERRRLEQKSEALNRVHGADLGELGRRAAIIVEHEADIAALRAKITEAGSDIATLQRSLAETTGEHAATSTALNGASILIERKDAELIALRKELAEESVALANMKDLLAREEANVAAQGEQIAHLAEEAESLRIGGAAKASEYQAALDAARQRENELHRKRRRGIESARAIRRQLNENAEALRLAAAETGQPGAEAEKAAAENEENAILRQTVNEIGAAIIRMAKTGMALPAPEDAAAKTERDDFAPRQSNVMVAKPDAPSNQDEALPPKVSPARRH